MAWKILSGFGAGYALLLTLAASGLVFANLVGLLVMMFEFGGETAPDPTIRQTWMHWGWSFGVCFALVGSVIAYRKKAKDRSTDRPSPKELDEHKLDENELDENELDENELDENELDENELDAAQQPPDETSRGRRHGFFASAAWGGFFGALLGGMVGGTFMLLWFSVMYSPFAPQDWGSSISVEHRRTGPSTSQETMLSTDHPVALMAFGVPVILGATAGAAFAGVYGATDLK